MRVCQHDMRCGGAQRRKRGLERRPLNRHVTGFVAVEPAIESVLGIFGMPGANEFAGNVQAGRGAVGSRNASRYFAARQPRALFESFTDGRHSLLRAEAGVEVIDFGSAVDVLWLQISRDPTDPVPAMSHASPQQGLVLIDRGDFWQCGYVIRKGGYEDLQAEGLPAFRKALAALAPLPEARFDEVTGWDQVHLLSIRLDRLKRWWVQGMLCIGDAAHAMSPVGGFGVNLAIQDAVAAARILAPALREGRLTERDLAAVEARRRFPTRATQGLQKMMRRKRKPGGEVRKGPPKFLKVIARMPLLAHLMGRLIGLGFRREKL